MALQKTVTGVNGLEMSYWKISTASFHFDGPPFNVQFSMNGYKDTSYRAKDASAASFNFRPVLSRTGDIDSWSEVASNILANTSGDIRPALYSWAKTQTGWVGGSADPNQSSDPINWSTAADV